MKKVFSNGPSKDLVINPFDRLLRKSSRLYLAAPYFTHSKPVLEAVEKGKSVKLLIELNTTTSPQALRKIYEAGFPNLAIRYLVKSDHFHAKIYIFDNAALLGSSNLTKRGLRSNREAVICLDQADDMGVVKEVQALFSELWDLGRDLNPEILEEFASIHASALKKRKVFDPDADIEKAVGRAEPPNINGDSRAETPYHRRLENLRQKVCDYKFAFDEVTAILVENDFRRPELVVADIGPANETNRFLNWVCGIHVVGNAWKSASPRRTEERRREIVRLGRKWKETDQHKVSKNYVDGLKKLEEVFRTEQTIEAAPRQELEKCLLSVHAFAEQSRFVKGGEKNLPAEFWKNNNGDVKRVKATLTYLLYGPGDFIQRWDDVLYSGRKLEWIGRSCVLELYGTIKPEESPPMNLRMAKALRYLGFDDVQW